MKKRILAIAVMVICLSILASVTFAYYTDSATARNVITSGGIKIEVVEQQMVNGTLQPWTAPEIPVMPSQPVSKIVTVRSDEQAAWVRMRYTLTVKDADGKVLSIPANELEKAIVIRTDSEHWTLKDGWWYYDTAIAGGESTAPLFEEVLFSGPDMDNKYQSCKVVIEVTAEAVQKVHNGDSVMEAVWTEN